MERRKFLAAAAATGSSMVAGCGGDGGGGVPGQTTTRTTTATTTTTATPERDEVEAQPADVGPYTDYMVNKEGASLFLFTYYPQYKWLIDHLPNQCMKNVVQDELTSADHPTGLIKPNNTDRYFYGFTDVDQLAYNVLWGSYDAESARKTATKSGEKGGMGFSAMDQSVGDFDLFKKEQMVFGVTPEMMITVDVGFADPVKNFQLVHDKIVNGKGKSFVSTHENYKLLTDHLQKGHRIQSRPNEAKKLGLGTKAYARQFTFANEKRSIIEEVLVWDSEPSKDQVRSTIEKNSGLYSTYDKPELAGITIDGRVAVVEYPPILNANIYRGSGYTGC